MNKYHARKTKIDGITFDSVKEASRYNQLKKMLENGEISNLEIHKKFELIPKQIIDGETVERATNYYADFVYTQNGAIVVEDVKSNITRKKPEYIIKRKLMLYRHGIRIIEK